MLTYTCAYERAQNKKKRDKHKDYISIVMLVNSLVQTVLMIIALKQTDND